MEIALSSSQSWPCSGPKLPALRRISNGKYRYPSLNTKHSRTRRLYVSALPWCFPHPSHYNQCNIFTRFSGPFLPTHGVAPSHLLGPLDDGPQAIDTVEDLYSAMRRRNPTELAGLIAENCKCTSNFTPSCNSFVGKKHVVEFLSALIGCMGESTVFEVDMSCHGEGDTVGVLWHLEWKGIHVPFGKGCTFYTCESKDGKMLIREMDIFMESFVKLGFLQLVRKAEAQDVGGHLSISSSSGIVVILVLVGVVFVENDQIDDAHLRQVPASCYEMPRDGDISMIDGQPKSF